MSTKSLNQNTQEGGFVLVLEANPNGSVGFFAFKMRYAVEANP